MKNEMSVMGNSGDTKVLWDPDNDDEVQCARENFEQLTEKGFAAFSVKRGGDKGSVIKDFDPEAGKIILVPPMAGG